MSHKLLGNLQKGLLFVVSAPAGTGKSTLINMLVKEFPEAIQESCSLTTRAPRYGELHKVHYEFVSLEEFQEKVRNGEFLEYAQVFNNYYGTSRRHVETIQQNRKHVVLVIDTQGALILKEKVKAIFIFISPPSLEELERRLFKRSTESEEKIKERLKWAKKELLVAPNYDYHIVNDDLMVSYHVLRSIFIAEEHKRR